MNSSKTLKAGHERTRRGKNREQPIEENDGVSSVQLILCKVLGVCLVILINFTVVFYFTHADDGNSTITVAPRQTWTRDTLSTKVNTTKLPQIPTSTTTTTTTTTTATATTSSSSTTTTATTTSTTTPTPTTTSTNTNAVVDIGNCLNCSFPFIYHGKLFTDCTDYYHTEPWCSVLNDENFTYISHWVACETDTCY